MSKSLDNFTDDIRDPYIGGYANSGGIIDAVLDTADYDPTDSIRGLLTEGGGTIVFEMENGSTQTFSNVPAYFEFRGFLINKVKSRANGTTATGIHPFF